MRIVTTILAAISLLSGCDAGHLGNPLALPIRGAVNAVQNATYDARRKRVKTHLEQNGLSNVGELFTIANTPETNHAKIVREIEELDFDSPDWPETATVIVMVHS